VAAVRVALSGLAAIFAALLVPYFLIAASVNAHHAASGEQGAVGFDVVSLLPQIVLSPWRWIIALSFFVLFLAASRLSSRALRVLLFWIPTLAVSTVGFCLFSLIAYLWLLSKSG
jgi:hypothetical protein